MQFPEEQEDVCYASSFLVGGHIEAFLNCNLEAPVNHHDSWSSEKSSSNQTPILVLFVSTSPHDLVVQDVYKEESLRKMVS